MLTLQIANEHAEVKGHLQIKNSIKPSGWYTIIVTNYLLPPSLWFETIVEVLISTGCERVLEEGELLLSVLILSSNGQ